MRFPSIEWPLDRDRVAVTRWIAVPGLTATALASNAQLAAASEPDALYYLPLGDSLAVGAQPIGGPDCGTAADEAGYHQPNRGTIDPLGVVRAVVSPTDSTSAA